MEIKSKYIIFDILSNKYYWQYRLEEGFSSIIENASYFDSAEEALSEINEQKDMFSNCIIEIKHIYIMS